MLVQQIDSSVIVALIGVLGGVLPVGITYVVTKNKEIDANTREERTKRYDGLISALVTFIDDLNRIQTGYADKPERDTVTNFIMAYHRSSAYASDDVLEKCNKLVTLMINKEGKSEDHDIDLDIEAVKDRIIDIYEAIRLDINPKAKYSKVIALWPKEHEVKMPSQPDKQK
jgi:hypothetical protein